MVVLARRASCDKKTLARQVIPLAPGYRTALSSRPDNNNNNNHNHNNHNHNNHNNKKSREIRYSYT